MSRRAPLLSLLFFAALAFAAPAPSRAADADSLAATVEVPWNPPRAVPTSEPWEAVVRFPGRVVSLPLALVGQGVRRTLLAAETGFYVQRLIYLFRNVPVPFGIGPASLGDRTGLGAGVNIAPQIGPVHVDAFFDASLKEYTRARTRLSAGFAFAEYRIDQRPTERFFGYGMAAREDDVTRYGLKQQHAIVGIDASSAERGPTGPREGLAAWVGPRWSRVAQGHNSDDASIVTRFPEAVAGSLDREIEHLTYGARLTVNHRGGQPHWTHGWRAILEAERYDRPFAESPSRTGAQFTRFGMLAETGFSLGRDPRTIRLTLTALDNDPGSDLERFLVSDLARAGGSNGIAGFEPQRFHHLDAVNLRAAYVFPLAQHFELDVHGDAGGVFGDLQEEFRPNRLRQSFGVGLRGRSRFAVLTTIGFDASPEAFRFVFSLGPER